MDRKVITIMAVIMLFVFIVGGLIIWLTYRTPWKEVVNQDERVVEQEQNNSNSQSNGISTFSLEEVAKHNIPQDCYLVIEDKVYDVTKYINSHPGGNEILRGCGKDATDLFVGKPHSDAAVSIKESYYIGDLAN